MLQFHTDFTGAKGLKGMAKQCSSTTAESSSLAASHQTSHHNQPLRSSASGSGSTYSPERRLGPADRRVSVMDRRNEERVDDDPLPRRNPDIPDRRA